MNEEQRIFEELRMMSVYMDSFKEKFDCGDIECYKCPVGIDLCLALQKVQVREKLNITSMSKVIVESHWKVNVILILSASLITKLLRWW